MDPNANLAEQSSCTDPARLRELRQALLEWIARGGCEPDWTRYPEAAKDFQAWARRYVP